jgi:hypothetical protein
MPALPLREAGPYVAGAYTLFATLLVAYVGIMARHVRRVRRQVRELGEEVARSRAEE